MCGSNLKQTHTVSYMFRTCVYRTKKEPPFMGKDIPKYAALIEWSKDKIHTGEFPVNSKFYSEMDLAVRFGISRQTVRHALEHLEQTGYIRRVRGSGTYVSYTGRDTRSKTMNIGVISTYLDDYIFPSIIRGIERVLTRHGYSMQLALTHNQVKNESRALERMLDGVDGLIMEPTKSGLPNANLDLFAQIEQSGLPLLFFNAHYPALSFPYVALDDEAAGRIATRHLIDAGHRRIAGFFQSDDLQGHLRYSGYSQAMKAAGLPVEDRNTLWYTTEDQPDLMVYTKRIRKRLEGCTALLCYNDQLSLSFLEFCRGQGLRIPEDLSLVSVDNSDLAAICEVPLTSVAHPMEQLGQTAAKNLLGLINGTLSDATFRFAPHLVERNSVRKL